MCILLALSDRIQDNWGMWIAEADVFVCECV